MTKLTAEQIAEKVFPIYPYDSIYIVQKRTAQRDELISRIKERDQVVWDAACKEMRDQNELDLSIAMNTSQSDIDTEKWVKIIKDGPTPPFKMDGE